MMVVAGQVALAVVLLTGISLLSESLVRLTRQPLGFDAANLVVVTTRAAGPVRVTPRDSEAVATTLEHLPGVVASTGVVSAPFAGSSGISVGLSVAGAHGRAPASADLRIVTENYFAALGVPIYAGRSFGPEDSLGGHVAVVSAAFNSRYFAGAGVGRQLILDETQWAVVGVAADVRQRSFRDPETPAVYLLNRQATTPGTQTEIRQFVVRTAPGVTLGAAEVTAATRRSAPGILVTAVTPMVTLLERSASDERYRADLVAPFGVAAVTLAAVGLFGLLSRAVVMRRREIGIRIALGATSADVMRLVLTQGASVVVVGLIGGLPFAVGTAHLMSSLLFGVTPGASHTFVDVTAVLAFVTLLATVGPTRRATAVDPVIALSSN